MLAGFDADLREKVELHVKNCILRHDEGEIEKVFKFHLTEASTLSTAATATAVPPAGLTLDGLKGAMKSLGHTIDDHRCKELFEMYDTDSSGCIGIDEFKLCLRARSKLEQWTSSMPFSELVASGLTPLVFRKEEEDAFKILCNASDDQLKIVSNGLVDGFYKILRLRVDSLTAAYKALNSNKEKLKEKGSDKSQSKFSFSMQCGVISDFYNGLGSRVGKPCSLPLNKKKIVLKPVFFNQGVQI